MPWATLRAGEVSWLHPRGPSDSDWKKLHVSIQSRRQQTVCRRPESKYWKLCMPHCLCRSHWTPSLLRTAVCGTISKKNTVCWPLLQHNTAEILLQFPSKPSAYTGIFLSQERWLHSMNLMKWFYTRNKFKSNLIFLYMLMLLRILFLTNKFKVPYLCWSFILENKN